MAIAIIPSEELSRRIEVIATKQNRSIESVIIEAIERFVKEQSDKIQILEIAKIQFLGPFRIP
jgi:predicted transcriptional regulator